MSMWLDKGWGACWLEFRPDFTAIEFGLCSFIDWSRDFVGSDASLLARSASAKRRLVTMTIAVDGIYMSNDEAILRDGVAVGYGSSDGHAHRVGQSIAIGYVSKKCATPGKQLAAEILGEMWGVTVLDGPAFDANGLHIRA